MSNEWLTDAQQQARESRRQRDVFREQEHRPWDIPKKGVKYKSNPGLPHFFHLRRHD